MRCILGWDPALIQVSLFLFNSFCAATQPTSLHTKGHGWNIHSLEIIKNVCKWVFTCHYKRENIYRIVVNLHGHYKTQLTEKKASAWLPCKCMWCGHPWFQFTGHYTACCTNLLPPQMPTQMLWTQDSCVLLSNNKSTGTDPWSLPPHLEQDTISDPFNQHRVICFLCVSVVCCYRCGHLVTWQFHMNIKVQIPCSRALQSEPWHWFSVLCSHLPRLSKISIPRASAWSQDRSFGALRVLIGGAVRLQLIC